MLAVLWAQLRLTPSPEVYVITRLNLYLLRQLLTAFLFASFAVSFVILFTQSFRLLSLVIDNSSTMLIFFQLMALSIPTFLPLVLPLALGVAVIFVYHKLSVDSELVVMRAVGASPLRQAMPALTMGGLVCMACFVLTLWITPVANSTLVALQYKIRDSYAVFLSHPGNFNDIADGLTFYAQKRGSKGELEGILIHDVRKPEYPVTIMADTGQVVENRNQPQIVIFNGRRQELDITTGRLTELVFDQYVLDLNSLRNESSSRSADPREESIWGLFAHLDNPSGKGTQERLVAEIHQRMTSPILALTYTLIGLSALLAGEFNRRGAAKRIFSAAVGIVTVQAGFMSLTGVIAHHAWMVSGQYALVILPCLLLLLLIGRDEFKAPSTPIPPQYHAS